MTLTVGAAGWGRVGLVAAAVITATAAWLAREERGVMQAQRREPWESGQAHAEQRPAVGSQAGPMRAAQTQPRFVPPDVGRNGVPEWQIDSEFKDDVFTFVRVKYDSWDGPNKWATDYPDADLNLSYRLQQLTSLKVDPEGRIVELTDPALFRYPFIYMIEPGGLQLSEEEAACLRRYLLNGGFLMVDDFWGEAEYANFAAQLRRVFPERTPEELPLEHPIFHCVYDLKTKPQIPGIGYARQGVTYERVDAQTPHYRGLFDDKGRLMAVICHNTDLGDGWEREGEDPTYFREFSEKIAYPLGINIIFHAMTH